MKADPTSNLYHLTPQKEIVLYAVVTVVCIYEHEAKEPAFVEQLLANIISSTAA
jgi:hypothetical protein